MIPVHEAIRRVLAQAWPTAPEQVSLEAALGRVLAQEVVAAEDVPGWDNSAMDGYAVRAGDLVGPSTTLQLNEVIYAGAWPEHRVGEGTASAIMTGAPMPEGADAVVPVEESDRAMEGRVNLRGVTTPGRYVRRRGADLRAGQVVLAAGTTLGPASLGVAAAAGYTAVAVAKRPTVGVVTTGDEVIRPGQALRPGQIRSTNHLTVAALAQEAGARVTDRGHAPDELSALVQVLGACEDDVVLSTGGVSVGAADLVQEAWRAIGVSVDFWKVRVKPGMPLLFGTRMLRGRRQLWFGLPGNPVSCMVNLLQFVRPLLREMQGDPRPHLPVIHLRSAEDMVSAPGRARFERVRLEATAQGWVCRSTGDQQSGILRSMQLADGLMMMGPEQDGVREGELVAVQLLDPAFAQSAVPVMPW